MKKAREIHEANDSLGTYACADTLEAKLVDRYYAVYQAHALEHAGRYCFNFHLNYPFRTYTLAGAPPQGGALNLFFVSNAQCFAQSTRGVVLQRELFIKSIQHMAI